MDILEKNKYSAQSRELQPHIKFERYLYKIEIEYKYTKHEYLIEDYTDLEALEQVVMEYFAGSFEGIESTITQYKKD